MLCSSCLRFWRLNNRSSVFCEHIRFSGKCLLRRWTPAFWCCYASPPFLLKSLTALEACYRSSRTRTMIYFCTNCDQLEGASDSFVSARSQSPDLVGPVTSGACVTTVFMTSGDAGLGHTYSEAREGGNEASYAYVSAILKSPVARLMVNAL